MSKQDDGGPAFPQNDAAVNRINNLDGMSLRDWFAGQALTGWTSDGWETDAPSQESIEKAVKTCYRFADAMLKARER